MVEVIITRDEFKRISRMFAANPGIDHILLDLEESYALDVADDNYWQPENVRTNGHTLTCQCEECKAVDERVEAEEFFKSLNN